MRLSAAVVILLLSPILAAADQKKAPQTNQPVTTLTGCVDEQPGEQYVLLDPDDMKQTTILEASGFPNTGFARFLGHTVRVTGRQDGSSVKVSKIISIRDTCSPPEPPSK